MAQITKFASDIDGKVFDTVDEQLAYDAGLKNKEIIHAFLNKHYPVKEDAKRQGPSRTIVEHALSLWLAEQ